MLSIFSISPCLGEIIDKYLERTCCAKFVGVCKPLERVVETAKNGAVSSSIHYVIKTRLDSYIDNPVNPNQDGCFEIKSIPAFTSFERGTVQHDILHLLIIVGSGSTLRLQYVFEILSS